MTTVSSPAVREANITTAGEGRYFKAYLHYLARWRSQPPSPGAYRVDAARARHLRGHARDVIRDILSDSDAIARRLERLR